MDEEINVCAMDDSLRENSMYAKQFHKLSCWLRYWPPKRICLYNNILWFEMTALTSGKKVAQKSFYHNILAVIHRNELPMATAIQL